MTAATAFAPEPGRALMLRDDLALVLAPNPSALTYLGTNSYVLGRDRLVVIDPGPADAAHLAALLAVIGSRPVDYILVTHSHLDHSALAPALAARTGAPVAAFGDSSAGRSAVMADLVAGGMTGGGEGIDQGFTPDLLLPDTAALQGEWGQLTALHTPGHIGNHLCFAWQDAVFCGDHVMGWSSSLVSPPDGDVTDFLASCRALARQPAAVFYAGHGAPITTPAARVQWLIDHRLSREAQIMAALAQGPASPQVLTQKVYGALDVRLHGAARRNVLAHLIDLYARGIATAAPAPRADAIFTLTGTAKPDAARN